MDLKFILETFNYCFTLLIVFPATIVLGIYLSFKLRFVQISKLKASFSCLTKKTSSEEGQISHFEAISAVLAGNFGTGNISGMAVALSTGGPGALVWMWIMVFLGTAIQYASCVLGVSYRYKSQNNEFKGGPMYYLRDGLGLHKTAMIFAVFTLFGALTVGNFAQINSIVLPLEKMGINAFYCSLILACIVGIVLIGGIQRIATFASYIVPFKALIYLGAAGLIIFSHHEKIIPAFQLMFTSAFGFSSAAGGFLGAGVFKAITTGFDRGLFATDAGTGIIPILQASTKSKHPVMDGIATLVAPLMVMIVCTTTGLVLILTGAWLQPELQSTNMVIYAFSKGLGTDWGGYIVLIALVLFAYTTILAWAYCGEKALEFLLGDRKPHLFRFFYIALIPLGTLIEVNLIWILADISITLMLMTNLIGIARLSPKVIQSTKQFQPIDLLHN